MSRSTTTSIASLSLSSLHLLQTLGQEKTTKKAAEKLFITQSAVSKSLKKVRIQLQDELFIRHPHGLTPTSYCERILQRLPELYTAIEEVLELESNFCVSEYRGKVNIAVSPVLYQPVVNKLFDILHEQAPNAELHFCNWAWDTDSKLNHRQIDMGINFSPLDISKNIKRKEIGRSEFKICCRNNHPIIDQQVSVETMAQYPLTMMILPHQYNSEHYMEKLLSEHGYTPKVLSKSDQMDICFNIVKKTQSIMAVSNLAHQDIPDGLQLVDVSSEVIVPSLAIATYTPSESQNSFHQWLIKSAERCVKELKEG